MKKLNPSQEKILAYLLERAQNSIPPSVREICKATGLKSTSTVHTHLKILEELGYISRESGLNRAIHISSGKSLQVPIINNSLPNGGLASPNNIEGYIPFNVSSDNKKEFFAFHVLDNSMKNSFILPQDIIIIEKGSKTSDSELTAIIYENKLLVRKMVKLSSNAYLFAENADYDKIELKNCQIVGKAISLIRNF